jgi:hypothetical protein
MSGYTYPGPAPTVNGDAETIHRFLQNPTLIARRLRGLLEQRYIADAILTGRFQAAGGAVMYESGEPIGTAEDPEAVAPGANYPIVMLASGPASVAKTVKWGQDAIVTDEAIKRLQRNPVDRAFTKLGNQSVSNVDKVAMAAVASKVTATTPLGAALAAADAEQILTAFLTARAKIVALDEGYMPDTAVLDDVSHAIVLAKFIGAGYLPRETGSGPLTTGDFPRVEGMTWLATNHGIADNGLVLDSTQLGGMADEDLGGPGYVRIAGIGVETKSIRDDDNDRYKLRARRVTVPVVLEPGAAGLVDLTA